MLHSRFASTHCMHICKHNRNAALLSSPAIAARVECRANEQFGFDLGGHGGVLLEVACRQRPLRAGGQDGGKQSAAVEAAPSAGRQLHNPERFAQS